MTSTRTSRGSRRSIPKPAALLNGSQRDQLSALAAGIEDALTEIERLLDPHLDGDSILTRYANDLPRDFDAQARPMLEALRAKLAVFADRFSLETRSLSRSSSIAANLLAQVIQLDESGMTQLLERGNIAPPLGRVLAPALEQFRFGFASIGALLSHHADRHRHSSAPPPDDDAPLQPLAPDRLPTELTDSPVSLVLHPNSRGYG